MCGLVLSMLLSRKKSCGQVLDFNICKYQLSLNSKLNMRLGLREFILRVFLPPVERVPAS